MSYNYQTEKPYVLTDEGQRKVIDVLKCADRAFRTTGAITAGKLMQAAGSGDSWKLMACVDRLVELGHARYVEQLNNCAWQDRIFVEP